MRRISRECAGGVTSFPTSPSGLADRRTTETQSFHFILEVFHTIVQSKGTMNVSYPVHMTNQASWRAPGYDTERWGAHQGAFCI